MDTTDSSVTKQSHVISFSGGKDSTAMLLMMLERGDHIADVVFFDTGWEFPQMYDHLELVEKVTGIQITRLRPRLPPDVTTHKKPFDYFFSDYPIKRRGDNHVSSHGRGWAAPRVRWCTSLKLDALRSHFTALTHRQGVTLPLYECVGIAHDERHRAEGKRSRKYFKKRFPLIEWHITEPEALAYCNARGFTWGGLYNDFQRLSCFCCPLKSWEELRTLRRHYPELYQHMLTMSSWLDKNSAATIFGGRAMTFEAVDEKLRSQTLFDFC